MKEFQGKTMSEFQNLPTRTLDNGQVKLEVLITAGPRIVRLSAFGKGNLFADVPASVTTAYGDFYFRGGHRLWHSPEALPRSYIPDNAGVAIQETTDGVILTGPTECGTGITKSIEIHLMRDQPIVRLNHALRNDSLWPVELAPWAITMFHLGGTVILPQPVGNADQDGLLSNRILAFWPYSHINDPRLTLRDDFILIHAVPGESPFKIGYLNKHGWAAYWIDGVLFRKTFEISTGAEYPDGGCNTESYCNDRFVELESLGPLTRIEPGASVELTETWELNPDLNLPYMPE
ncbi:MAG: hypothetical protein EHM70_20060, partial [Chloroflexota bacterium]